MTPTKDKKIYETSSSISSIFRSDEKICTDSSDIKLETTSMPNHSSIKCQEMSMESEGSRKTEIVVKYYSDEMAKHEQETNIDFDSKKCPKQCKAEEWTKVITTKLESNKDILLEIDTSKIDDCQQLKDIQAVELVIAVQSAIKQRQNLIEEWKNKTFLLTEQLERLQKEKHCLEKSNLSKESELECLAKKLHELHKQYSSLSHESAKLKRELEMLGNEYASLLEAYNCTVREFKEIKCKLSQALEMECRLETLLREQVKKTETAENESNRLECELSTARHNIKTLTCSLEETTKELLVVQKTLEEYRNIENKLNRLKCQYKNLKEKYECAETSLGKALEENSNLKDVVTKLYHTIETLTSDKNELLSTVECLTHEKNVLSQKNKKLVHELNCAKKNFAEINYQLSAVQSEVSSLKSQIEDLESRNKNLKCELKAARQDNHNLSENLKNTIGECSMLSRALTDAQCQLEVQQQILSKAESKVNTLLQEKQHLENKINCLTEDLHSGAHEINRLNCDNASIRNQNNELICSLNQVTFELNEKLTEIGHLSKEIETLKHTIETEREKHERHMHRLQEKIRRKSQEWKEYVTNEINRLRNKRRADVKKYLELNKELENRLLSSQRHAKIIEEELNSSIMDLKNQLDCALNKLDETIIDAESQRNELIQRFTAENSKLVQELEKQKLESQWAITEMESKLQDVIQKNLDDAATINMISHENSRLKDKIKKLYVDRNEMHELREEIKTLLEYKHKLECELVNCKGLLDLAENTVSNLREENSLVVNRLKGEEDQVKLLQTKLVKLKRIIGKKDAQINTLESTINQTRERLSHVVEENDSLKCTLYELEQKNVEITEKIHHLNIELNAAKNALCEAREDKVALLRRIEHIEKEIVILVTENDCLKQELETAKENQYITEKALENSHHAQLELKDRLYKAESSAAKYCQEARNLECKLIKVQEHVKNLENEIQHLNDKYNCAEQKHHHRIKGLESQLNDANEEICRLKHHLEKSERRINRLRHSLKESENSLRGLMTIFDSLRETICQVLCLEFVPISSKVFNESCKLDDSTCSPKNYGEILKMYKCETETYSCSLIELKRNENELACKLINTKKDFEKLSLVMKELQAEYTNKLEKLHHQIKEKENCIRILEKQIVQIQLEAANADEVMAHSFEKKLKESQTMISKLQDEKSILQSEILCLSKKVNDLEAGIYEMIEKLKCAEGRNSKLQVKNVALEGDIEKLALLLKEARDKEQEQICQYKQMMLANRELMEKIRNLKCLLDSSQKELEECKCSKKHMCHETKSCTPSKHTLCENELEIEVKILTDKLHASHRAEHEAKCALSELQANLSSLKKHVCALESEKANLEGWVSHLQQLVSSDSAQDKEICISVEKAKQENKLLEKKIKEMKHTINSLVNEKEQLQSTVQHLSDCNTTLEQTMSKVRINKEKLEEELTNIQGKLDSLCQGMQSSDCEISTCGKDIFKMIKNAYSLTKCLNTDSFSSSDEQAHKIFQCSTKSSPSKLKFPFQESTDSIAISVNYSSSTSKNDSQTGCCVKPFTSLDSTSSRLSNVCQDCQFIEKKHTDSSECQIHEKKCDNKHTKNKDTKQKSADSLFSEGLGKTFV